MYRTLARILAAALLAAGVSACEGSAPGTGPRPDAAPVLEAGPGSRSGAPGDAVSAAVIVRTAAGAPLAGASVRWTVAAGGGAVSAPETVTDAQGQASVTWTLGSLVGEQALDAAVTAAAPLRLYAEARPPAAPPAPVQALALEQAYGEYGLVPGQPAPLTVWMRNATGQMQPHLSTDGAWSSSAPAVATVDAAGVVTAHAPGEAQIRMEWQGVAGTLAVRVHPLADVGAPTRLWAPAANDAPWSLEVDEDGTVYEVHYGKIGPGALTPRMVVVSPDGQVSERANVAVAVVPGGGVVLSAAGQVQRLRSDGTEAWSLATCAGCVLSPAAGADGTVYLVGEGRLRAVRPDGTVAWNVEVPGGRRAEVGTGVVYVYAFDASTVTGVSTAGVPLWRTDVGAGAWRAMVDGAGTLYLSSQEGPDYVTAGQLAAVAPDGTVRWKVQGTSGRLSAGAAGTVLVTDDSAVTARAAQDGAVRWRTRVPGLPHRNLRAFTGADGRVYVATCHVYVLEGSTGVLLGRSQHRFCGGTDAVLRNGRLVVLGHEGIARYTLPSGPSQGGVRRR